MLTRLQGPKQKKTRSVTGLTATLHRTDDTRLAAAGWTYKGEQENRVSRLEGDDTQGTAKGEGRATKVRCAAGWCDG